MKIRQVLALSGIILLSVNFYSCKTKIKAPTASIEFSEEVARVVNYVTSGNILPEQALEIVFYDEQVPAEEVGKPIENTFLDISPSISGIITWSNEYTLSFTPDDNWKMRETYTINLELKNVSSALADLSETLKYSIYIEGQEIEQFSGELVLKERNNPKLLTYLGKISLKLPVEEKELKNAFSIKKGSKKIDVNLTNTGDNLLYTFESEALARDDNSASYKVIIDSKSLGLADDYETGFEITPLQKMLVKQVSKDEGGQHPRFRILFSDDLELSQDINGYFSTNPEVSNFKVSKSGNTVILDGAFKFGETYTVIVNQGLESRWATKLEKNYSQKIKFSDLSPSVEFAADGMVMPTSNNSKLQFQTANLTRVHLEVKKVFSKRLPDFIRSEEISGVKNRHNGFTRNYGGQVGIILLNKTLELGDTKNEWLLNEIDLSDIFDSDAEGFYLIRLNFNPRDMLVPVTDEEDFVADNGEIYKPVVVSNLGLTVKQEDDRFHVFVTDLLTTKPVSGAVIKGYRWSDSYDYSATTNNQGHASFSSDYGINFITAEKNNQISYLKLRNMEWNTSGFDISGVSAGNSGLRTYIYTERGVYRPGDDINLSVIVRNQDNSFPTNHPVTMTLFNPDNQNVLEIRNNEAADGFYTFSFKTKDSDPTGNWEARISAGSRNFYHTLKIETVVPYKLKVRMENEQNSISAKDSEFDFALRTNYLFGTPAAGLSFESEVEVIPRNITFPKYQNFSFSNEYSSFSTYTRKISAGTLDSNGIASVSWNIPSFEKVPSALYARFINTVYEKGGRPNVNRSLIPFHYYENYVGIQKPAYWYHYVTTNEESTLQVVCVDAEGNPVEGKKLLYRIYQNTSHWWYHYDDRRQYQLRYKTDNNTSLLTEGSITSGKNPVNINFTPREDGDYLIEVQEGGYDGHMVSQFVYAYAWGSVPSGDQNAGTLMLKADKAKYQVGETAVVSFPAPAEGAILYSMECGDKIMDWKWIDNSSRQGDNVVLNIPITRDMVPNTYLTISVIQPHAQTENDRPIRMFGILPLFAEDPDTRQELNIVMADELEPNKPFEVTVQTKDHQPTQFTIAVVDEGLLDLTNFQTPDPWKEFFKKLQLEVSTYDLFSQIIGVNKGDIFKTFSIGGDMDFREQQLNPEKGKKRFKPVCLFEGPVHTNSDGKAVVKFTMPEYNGSVRVMVVSANENTYGKAEKTVPVLTDLMVEPSIPRVLGPDEDIILPVNVFAMKENIGKVKVSVQVEGPLEIDGNSFAELNFSRATDKEVYFRLKSQKATGQAKIVVSAESSKLKAESTTDIQVRASAPRNYSTESKKITPGETIRLTIPDNGLPGTNTASLKIQKFPNMNFGHRLEWLIRYPYGCIEQTTSSVFPQLYLKSFIEDSQGSYKEIDNNIAAGIDKLVRFQTSSGGMSYWPGNTHENEWGSIYAAHFLVEATKKGYHVPDYLYDNLLDYLHKKARWGSDDEFVRVYRVYVLSLADKDVTSEINRLRQDKFEELSDVQKYMLAAAYYNLGKQSTATSLLSKINKEYTDYDQFNPYYGSRARDMGIILNAFVDMKEDEYARLQAEEIARLVSSRDWYSTHSMGYMLLSLGRYFDMIGMSTAGNQSLKGSYSIEGKKVAFNSTGNLSYTLQSGFGKELTITFDADATIETAYIDLNWSGVPLLDNREKQDEKISLEVEWLDENGRTIDPSLTSQAQTIYGHFVVKNSSTLAEISEVALVQILPSGWEIENIRLSGDEIPLWASDFRLNMEDYTDIRDDRIMWFFDLQKVSYDFLVKVNVVTQGDFYMPPTVCEAMYSNEYFAVNPGKKVIVKGLK